MIGPSLPGGDALLVITLALATWRVTSILSQEDIFRWTRERIGVVHNADGTPAYGRNWIASLAACPWCLSVWIAPLVILCVVYIPIVVAVMALSGASCLIESTIMHVIHAERS